jgi:hypothetical protein
MARKPKIEYPSFSPEINTLAYINGIGGKWALEEWDKNTGVYTNGKTSAIVEVEDDLLSVQFDGMKDVEYFRIVT